MGLEPIRVELTDFLKLELLREEEERLSGELGEIEKKIRECLIAKAERDYLKSISPYYASQAAPAGEAPDAGGLEGQRTLVHQTLETVRGQRQQYEEALGVSAAARATHGPARRAAASTMGGKRSRFDSFEDFRQSQDQGPAPGQTQG